MKGKILDFSVQNSVGVISGDDGKRYNFKSSEWKSDKAPTAGQTVDFNTDAENAVSIYLEKSANNLPKSKSKVIIATVAATIISIVGGFLLYKNYQERAAERAYNDAQEELARSVSELKSLFRGRY